NIQQRGKAAVVIKTAFGMCPQAVERRGTVAIVWRTAPPEVLDADIHSQVHIPSWLSHERRYMAAAAMGFAAEDLLAARSRRVIKAVCRRRGCRQGELVEMERRKLGGNLIVRVRDMPETVARCYGEFRCIVQSRIKEVAFAMHL